MQCKEASLQRPTDMYDLSKRDMYKLSKREISILQRGPFLLKTDWWPETRGIHRAVCIVRYAWCKEGCSFEGTRYTLALHYTRSTLALHWLLYRP